MTMDHVVMRGDLEGDATRLLGLINEGNFSYKRKSSPQRWFNRLFNGADTNLPEKGAAFAQVWLKNYTSQGPSGYIRHIGEAKLERYQKYYSDERDSREKPNPVPNPKPAPNPNSAPTPKPTLIVRLPLPPIKKSGAATLAESGKDTDGEQGDEEVPLLHEPRKQLNFLEFSARVKRPGTTDLGSLARIKMIKRAKRRRNQLQKRLLMS